MKANKLIIVVIMITLSLAANISWAQMDLSQRDSSQRDMSQSSFVDVCHMTLQGQNLRGTYKDTQYKIFWSTPEAKGHLRTRFNYIKKPFLKIYINSTSPLILKADMAKVDTIEKDLLFTGDVILKTKQGTLKTNFLKFNLSTREITSYDNYIFKTQEATFSGRAFFGSASSHSIELFNIPQLKTLILSL